MAYLHIIAASTSGHTDYVLDVLAAYLKEKMPSLKVVRQRAEQAQPEDLLRGDVLLLACGTWNTGGVEGQLNPHMHELLHSRAKGVNLDKKRVALIGLGDKRYRYTALSLQHLETYTKTHGGKMIAQLRIVNEPYGQERAVEAWGKQLVSLLSSEQ